MGILKIKIINLFIKYYYFNYPHLEIITYIQNNNIHD